MVALPLLLLGSLVATKASAQDSLLHRLTPNELKLYALTIRDVIASLTPRDAAGPFEIALDPNIRRETTPPSDMPWAAHLDGPSLRILIRDAGIHRLCEPLPNNA